MKPEDLPAGREMDELIAQRIFGFEKLPFPATPRFQKPRENGFIDTMFNVPPYSTDISAAWQLVERLNKNGWSFEITSHYDAAGDFIAQVWRRDSFDDALVCRADTAPLAICRVAVLSMEKK